MTAYTVFLIRNFFYKLLLAIRNGLKTLGIKYANGEIDIEDIPEEFRDVVIYYSETEEQK